MRGWEKPMKKSKADTQKSAGKVKRIITAVILTLVALAGLSLLLYPTVADFINVYHNKRVVGDYQKQVKKLDKNTYDDIVSSVQEYNAELAASSPFIKGLTPEKRKEYSGLLDIMGTGVMGYIEIDTPSVNISLAIYHGTSEGVLHTGAGHLEGSSLPIDGESVHTVLSAHSGLPSAKLFTNIDRLKVGETFELHVLNEVLTYEIDNIVTVLPEEVEGILSIEEGKNLCTLMTCTPYGVNTHRLLVTGHRIETPQKEEKEESTIPFFNVNRNNAAMHPMYIIIPVVIVISAVSLAFLLRFLKKRKDKRKNY